MTAGEIVREYFPNATDQEVEFILNEKTGWPCFFVDGENSLREQLAKFKRATDLGRDVCYCCGKIRTSGQMRFEMCVFGIKRLNREKYRRVNLDCFGLRRGRTR